MGAVGLDEREWVECPVCDDDGFEVIEQGEPPWTGTIRVECSECGGAGGWYADEQEGTG